MAPTFLVGYDTEQPMCIEAVRHRREPHVPVVRTCLGGDGHGKLPDSADQAIPGIPDENMQMLWDTAREVGRY